ncbi:hypothetical protein ACFOD4_13945 [Pseudoroseomonas globiformis]|uniref:Uncharacterized protein n=1 Tax=Teichococcus globiformis TaxID=2307229 RepID=A0ABV7G3B7_9PROT
MRRALLLASIALPPLLGQPAAAQAPAVPVAAAAETASVRVRTGQHNDRGRVVLHFGAIPSHELRRVGSEHELWLRGRFQLNLSGQRPLAELTGMEVRQEGDATVLRLRPACDCVVETGAFDGMLYVDLRPARTVREPASPAQLAAARRRLLDDAVRLGLLRQDQAIALLRSAGSVEASPSPVSSAAAPMPAPVPADVPAAPALSPHAAPPASTTTKPPTVAGAGTAAPTATDSLSKSEIAALRDTLMSRLALLNGQPSAGSAAPARSPMAATAPSPPPNLIPAASAGPAAPEERPMSAMATAPLPNPAFPAPSDKPVCLTPSFSLIGWAGMQPFNEALAGLRAGLARSDHGAAEAAALAEFYVGQELPREALEVLSNRLGEAPGGEVRQRLERVRDVARLLGRQPIEGTSPLLADAGDCTPPDLPLWQGLLAALRGDANSLARLAPRIRAALRDVPAGPRLSLVATMAEIVEDDTETLRTLLGALRGPGALGDPRPEQTAVRSLLMARLAHAEGNRPEELQHLQAAVRNRRSLAVLQARIRLAALQFDRPGAEGRQAELVLLDASRTFRRDSLGEEAAILYAQRLLERGDIAAALAVADGASQAMMRPSAESRGARLAARALRLLLVDAKGLALPPAGERLALFWQYEGYATPGERGDDIRRGAVQLMLQEGLADAALDIARQLTPATLLQQDGALLTARAEAMASQGDARRAMALLRSLPPSDALRRAASVALTRLGQPADAAEELRGMEELADRQSRAGLLFQAQSWADAMAAYGALLRDPELPPDMRGEATQRLAAAAALAGGRPDVPNDLLTASSSTKALLHLSGNVQASERGVSAARAAIARSRQVERLLPDAGRN